MENSKAIIPRSAHGRLQEENNCSDFTMIFLCFGSGWAVMYQSEKKIIFTACHSGKLKLSFTSPDSFQPAPKTF